MGSSAKQALLTKELAYYLGIIISVSQTKCVYKINKIMPITLASVHPNAVGFVARSPREQIVFIGLFCAYGSFMYPVFKQLHISVNNWLIVVSNTLSTIQGFEFPASGCPIERPVDSQFPLSRGCVFKGP